MAQLTSLLLTLILVMYAPTTGGHSGETDDIGCHYGRGDTYHCHSGPLGGLEFQDHEEAMAALESRRAEESYGVSTIPTKRRRPAQNVTASPTFKVLAWDVRRLGAEKFDYDRVALILADADIAVLHGLELGEGKGALNIIADLLEERSHERICRAWTRSPSGQKQVYAFVWKEHRFGYLTEDGELKEECEPGAFVIPPQNQSSAGPVFAKFVSKTHKRVFELGAIYLPDVPKYPDREVLRAFRRAHQVQWPVILAGDFRFSSSHKAFQETKDRDFSPALIGKARVKRSKRTYENFWSRGATSLRVAPVDLHARFSDITAAEVDKGLSDRFPLVAEFKFAAPSIADEVEVKLLSKGDSEPVEKSTATLFSTPKKPVKKEPPKKKVILRPKSGAGKVSALEGKDPDR
ncbi:MAG: hypothetical protein AB7P49_14690 [Bdellovibrionales bacterium]